MHFYVFGVHENVKLQPTTIAFLYLQMQAEMTPGLKSGTCVMESANFVNMLFSLVHLTTNFCSIECQNICPVNFNLTFHVDRDYCYCVLL